MILFRDKHEHRLEARHSSCLEARLCSCFETGHCSCLEARHCSGREPRRRPCTLTSQCSCLEARHCPRLETRQCSCLEGRYCSSSYIVPVSAGLGNHLATCRGKLRGALSSTRPLRIVFVSLRITRKWLNDDEWGMPFIKVTVSKK